MSSNCMKLTAVVTVTMLAITLFIPLSPRASATPTTIASIDPDSGPVGTIVRVIGEIDTLGGSYDIWWDGEILLKEGTCPSDSKEVDDTFTVPSSSEGVHDVVLWDLTSYTESAPVQFALVTVSYALSMEPARIQEGLDTNITLNLRNATLDAYITFNINVTSPTDISYFFNLTVSTNGTGYGSNQTIFFRDFADANTDFVGIYNVTLLNLAGNETLATSNFTVGLTDKLKYSRSENVSIRGSGYAPNEPVIVDLKYGNASVSTFPQSINASLEGVVTSYWQIPSDAAIGAYTLTISNSTADGTVKTPADVQTFTVEGVCEIQTRNLADEPLTDVTVEVYNATFGDFLNLSQETNETGWARFLLVTGNYTFKAFWKNVEVGAMNQSVIENVALRLEVRLSYLKLTVTDETGAPIPFTDLNLSYNYTTRANVSIPETGLFVTHINGTVVIQNAFTNISYLIAARRYGLLFNTTFIENLAAQAWNNITIIAPTYNMFVQILDSKNAPAEGLTVSAYEWSSGISEPLQPAQTDSNGNITFSLTVGRYRLRVYQNTAFVNEVTVDLVNDPSFIVVRIDVYKVDLNVLVVDYFGQPIPNVLVEFQRKVDSNYQMTQSQTTEADGIARFKDLIGGDSRVSVSVAGRLGETEYLYLVGPTRDIVFKMDGYVAVIGHALETSQFVTIILFLILIVSFFTASTYRRLPRLFKRRRK